MTLVKFNPTFPGVFDDFFNENWFNDLYAKKNGNNLPAVNVKENEKGFQLELAAPGLKKEDFNVEIDENVLTISSEKKVENSEKDKEGNYTRKEFSYQSFKRSFTLPENANEENVEAKYQDGILNVFIPKKVEKEKEVKKLIKIS